ncbi:MAG: hypothetical protein Q9191_006971 [Dirinaria sp. TL-2023a]
MAPTVQRQTANALIDAFNSMSIPDIISFRAPGCMRQILPYSLNYPSQSNDAYRDTLRSLLPAFRNFSLTLYEIIEDVEQRKIVMHLRARADTAAGEYANEYMWVLRFDEQGKISDQKEYVDVGVNRDFFPKLQAALTSIKNSKSAQSANAVAPRTSVP